MNAGGAGAFGARRDRIRARLEDLGADALLVTHPPNVRYLSGFTGSSGALLVGAADLLVTDSRYETQAAGECPGCGLEIAGPAGMTAAAAEAVATLGAARLGFESERMSVAAARRLSDALGDRTMVETANLVEGQRAVKDEGEIAALRRAAAIADEALPGLLAELREGIREREAAAILEERMRRAGAERPAFESIVAFGESAAEPHHRAGERPLRRGDVVKLDFGAVWDGYHSDMTRTVAFGPPPEEIARIHAAVLAAQETALAAVRAGAAARDVDAAAREALRARGYEFGHGTGHGCGLEIHEAPAVGARSADILASGMVVTVEPGVYLPGIGGVRIEDLAVVRDGAAEILTRSAKDLLVV